MRILVDIGHPAHVHYFRNTIKNLEKLGYVFLITARSKKVIFDLLDHYNLEYIERGEGGDTILGKLVYLLRADFKLILSAIKFKPDIFLSFTTPYAAHASFLLRKPHLSFNDTEHVDRVNSILTFPFCTKIFTPKSYLHDLGKNHVRFNSVMEGFYLHPKYFKPQKKNLEYLNLVDDEPYVILRFVSWNAHHDIGHNGLDHKTKLELVKLLSSKYRIFISSESKLPDDLVSYKINIPPAYMHDVLAFAELFIGESATMVSECALLGTPAVYVNSLPQMGYLQLEEEEGLIKQFKSSENVVDYVKHLIQMDDIKSKFRQRSSEMQEAFNNPTDMLCGLLKNYPESVKNLSKEIN